MAISFLTDSRIDGLRRARLDKGFSWYELDMGNDRRPRATAQGHCLTRTSCMLMKHETTAAGGVFCFS